MADADLPELPELPFVETVGVLSFIQPRWGVDNQQALNEAVAVAEWLDAKVERRSIGETIPDKPVQRLTLTVEEAASALGISRSFAYEAIAKGEIPCIRIGKRILVPKVALAKMLESTGDAAAEP